MNVFEILVFNALTQFVNFRLITQIFLSRELFQVFLRTHRSTLLILKRKKRKKLESFGEKQKV